MRGFTTGTVCALVAACGPSAAPTADAAQRDASTIDAPVIDAPPCGELTATLRDFQAAHPDFEEANVGDDRGVVEVMLGTDSKPVKATAGATITITSQASFDQWYRDVPGVNMTFTEPLALVEGPPGTFTFDDQEFFPLDTKGFGEEGNPHNYHFTSEIHATFKYRGGESFRFTGDDDVWVFVNRKLALDLGGVHGPEDLTIDFDARAAELGITLGGTYNLDVFHAERHTSQSTFRMVTTIDCFIIQ